MLEGQQICSHEACYSFHYIFLFNKDIIFLVWVRLFTFPKIIFVNKIPRTTFFCQNQAFFISILKVKTQTKKEHLHESVPTTLRETDACACSNFSRKSGHSTLDLIRSHNCMEHTTFQAIKLNLKQNIKYPS